MRAIMPPSSLRHPLDEGGTGKDEREYHTNNSTQQGFWSAGATVAPSSSPRDTLWPADDRSRGDCEVCQKNSNLSWHSRCHSKVNALLQENTSVRVKTSLVASITVWGLFCLLWPVTATAQFRYPMPAPYGYGYGPDSSLRVEVKPKEAAVYVDGYYAGIVDDFDGVFQRLHVVPGQHEVVIYLEGYRSLHQSLYLSPNSTRKILGTLERLEPGEPSEPPPVPLAPSAQQFPGARPPLPRRGGPPPPPPSGPPAPPLPPDRQSPSPEPASAMGTVVIRVQPAGADVLIDGARWNGPTGDERLVVQLADGSHVVEIRKEGYRTYKTEIQVQRGQTSPLNVSLTKQ